MATHAEQLIAVFEETFTATIQQDILRGLFNAYRVAGEQVADRFDRPEAHDLLPHLRRAVIEQELRGVAERHSLGASAELNPTRSSYHSKVTAGRVVLTASRVDGPDEMVEHAVFRQGYASAQFDFFKPQPPDDASIYAILLHGPRRPMQDSADWIRPAFARIAFPDSNLTSYVTHIDLFGKFSGLIAEFDTGGAPPSQAAAELRPAAALKGPKSA